MIRFLCYNCNAVLKTPEEKVGRAINCPRCRKLLRVPPAVGQDQPGPAPEVLAARSAFRAKLRRLGRYLSRLAAAAALLGLAGLAFYYFPDSDTAPEPTNHAAARTPDAETKDEDEPKIDWVAQLSDEDIRKRHEAAVVLDEQTDDAGGLPAVPAYLRILEDNSTDKFHCELRQIAVVALGKVGAKIKPEDAKGVLGQLYRSADGDPDEQVRRYAIQSLGKIGTPALDELVRLIMKSNRDNGVMAMDAIAGMGNAASGYLPEMVKQIRLARDHSKVLLIRAIVKINPAYKDPKIVDALLAGLRTSDPEIRKLAINALEDMGPHAKNCLGALYDVAVNDENVDVKNRANVVYKKLSALAKKKPK